MVNLRGLPSPVVAALESSKNAASFAVILQQCVLNSIEAAARLVEVDLDLAQLSAIVRDDGRGIAEDRLQTACETNQHAVKRHTLTQANDRPVDRGQTLAVLGQLCVLEITSRAKGSFETHSKLVRGGKCLRSCLARNQQQRPGTTLSIRDFLYNLPVRRKQLLERGVKAELAQICKLILQLALSHTEVTLKITDSTTQQQVLHLPKDQPARAFGMAFGSAASSMQGSSTLAHPLSLTLSITTPPEGATVREAQHAFLNGRPLALADPLVTTLDTLHRTACQHLSHTQHKPAGTCKPHPRFLLQLSCPWHMCSLTRVNSHYTASFADWAAVEEVLLQACERAWKAVVPGSALAQGVSWADRGKARQPRRKRMHSPPQPVGQPMLQHMPAWRLASCKVSAGQQSHSRQHSPHKRPRLHLQQGLAQHNAQSVQDPPPQPHPHHQQAHAREHDALTTEPELALDLAGGPKRAQHAQSPPDDRLKLCQLQQRERAGAERCNELRPVPALKVDLADELDEQPHVQRSRHALQSTARQLQQRMHPDNQSVYWILSACDDIQSQSQRTPMQNQQHYMMQQPHRQSISGCNEGAAAADRLRRACEPSAMQDAVCRSHPAYGRDQASMQPRLHASSDDQPQYHSSDRRAHKPQPDDVSHPDLSSDLSLDALSQLQPTLLYESSPSSPSQLQPDLLCDLSPAACGQLQHHMQNMSDVQLQSPYSPPSSSLNVPCMSLSDDDDDDMQSAEGYGWLPEPCTGSPPSPLTPISASILMGTVHASLPSPPTISPPQACHSPPLHYHSWPDAVSPPPISHGQQARPTESLPALPQCKPPGTLSTHDTLRSRLFPASGALAARGTSRQHARPCREPGVCDDQRAPVEGVSDDACSDAEAAATMQWQAPSQGTCRRLHVHTDDLRQMHKQQAPPAVLPSPSHTQFQADQQDSLCQSEWRRLQHLEESKTCLQKQQQPCNPEHAQQERSITSSLQGTLHDSERAAGTGRSQRILQTAGSLSKAGTHTGRATEMEGGSMSAGTGTGTTTGTDRDTGSGGRLQGMLQKWHNPCWGPQCSSIPDLDALGAAALPTLVPQVMTREQLAGARSLAQVDAKFIAARAGDMVAMVDQHAADERVKLEQLRDQAMHPSGMPRDVPSIPLLPVQRLDLDFNSLAALEAYAPKVAGWGWAWQHLKPSHHESSEGWDGQQGSAGRVMLTHVPLLHGRILGAADLQDFLQHLAATNGIASVPPGATRTLNSRACRSALMFGTVLQLHETAQLLQDLGRTRLCFACAHGRPTLAPVVHLPTLRLLMDRARAASQFSTASTAPSYASAEHTANELDGRTSLRRLVVRLKVMLNSADPAT